MAIAQLSRGTMYANDWPSDNSARVPVVGRQRAVGRIAFSAQQIEGLTRPMRIAESGSMRIRLPKNASSGIDAVIVNTAGGVACGDRFDIDIEAQAGTFVTVATPAAEKIYRSDGPISELSTTLTLGEGARLDWLPQETILYDRARLSRRLDADIAETAVLSIFEAVVFGRAARHETMTEGLFIDRWRIRRGQRMAYADTLKLSGAIAELLQKKTIAGGARALATFLYIAPDAEARLEDARNLLGTVPGCQAAASAWNGLLAVRFCAVTIESLRDAASRFLVGFRAAPLPRVWLS
ncbi:urease accessory protein UreD [Microvirga antarctica]|uniref:urease accessory protein UreD n=1 Tax=Microvirga antarctica TaxID=2819233 RepID=UPI001FECB415|nr:urease accessory protein UreD [Microvirga antarctica]